MKAIKFQEMPENYTKCLINVSRRARKWARNVQENHNKKGNNIHKKNIRKKNRNNLLPACEAIHQKIIQ